MAMLPSQSMKKEKNNTTQITIGVDLGDTQHRYHVLDQAGNTIGRGGLLNSREAFTRLAEQYPGARVAIEVGTHSPWISAHLLDQGCEVYVANARKLRAIYENERKCDEYDAEMLARIARVDTSLLKPITHISQKAMTDRLVLRSREQLVESRKSLMQSVRGSVKSLGYRIDSCSASVFAKRARVVMGENTVAMCGLEPILRAIEEMSESIAKLDAEVERLGREEYEITKIFRQISGVGPVSALAFALAIEDPGRIGKTRDVGAYLGIVPRRDQSGGTDKSLGISKTGNAYVRKLLVQCAQHILGASRTDCDLRRFGLKLAERGGKAAKKKAIVAVARKLAVLLLSLWKSGEDYDPDRIKNRREKVSEALRVPAETVAGTEKLRAA